MGERPKLLKVDPEMQRWCERLESEVSSWPGVTARPMFGMNAYYRGKAIFAAIPRTRAMNTAYSLLIKRPSADVRQARASGRGPGAGWVTIELESEADIAGALGELGRAYERARPVRRAVRR